MSPAENVQRRPRVAELLQGVEGLDWKGDAPPLIDEAPMDPVRFLLVAEQMALAVSRLHERGVTHGNLCPENFRRNGKEVVIAGFQNAVTFDAGHIGFAPLDQLPGDLSYLAPEQTGRMNRPVDYRADLYALGGTLYRLATGCPPFSGRDRAALIHAHLAEEPPSPEKISSWVPPAVSQIIRRLLAKEPDERYQSASGLADDLAQLRAAAERGEPLERVSPRAAERVLVPRVPRRHLGRDRALGELLAAFDALSSGGSECLFLAGEAGVGKTSLVNELQRPVALRSGRYVSGKCDQYQRDRPLLAPVQALRQLLDLLAGESEETLGALRSRLLAGLGTDAGALAELLPGLTLLTGDLPPPPALEPREAQRRLTALLVRLIGLVASPRQPLVLVLDDLQWADQPTLDFVAALLEDDSLDGVMLAGLFRKSELDNSPVLRRVLEKAPSGIVQLENLPVRDLSSLLGEMLGTPAEETAELAAEIHRTTLGNPFHAIELVQSLHREGILSFDADTGRWTWNREALAIHPPSTNVVDFLTRGLSDFPPATADMLVAAACLGSDLTLDLISRAAGRTTTESALALLPALERGVLVTPDAQAFSRNNGSARFAFCHDRMQQAAVSLRDETWRRTLHLEMGRRLAGLPDDVAERWRAAQHYAEACDLLEDPEEKENVAALFLDAARRSRTSGAFPAAHRFLLRALGLLAPEPWHYAPELAWKLHEELHVVCYCLPDYPAADTAYAELNAHSPGPEQLAGPAAIQVMSLSNRTRYEEALQLGASLLHRLGLDVPLDNAEAMIRGDLARLYDIIESGALRRLPGRDSGAAHNNPAARLLNRMVPAAFFCRPQVADWLVVQSARSWLDGNYDDARLYPMACLALATIPARGDYATGYQSARAALSAGEAGERGVETARVRHVFGLFNCHWFEPLEHGLAQAHEAHDALLRSGELEFACYTYFTSQAALLDTGTSLSDLESENLRAAAFAARTGNIHAAESYTAFRYLLDSLTEEKNTGGHEIPAANPMAACFHHTMRALVACLFGDDDALVRHAGSAAKLAPYLTGFYPTAWINVLESMALLARLRRGDGDPGIVPRLAANQDWLAARAADAPVNFAHWHDLIEAERLSVSGKNNDALAVCERAIRRAKAHHRPWHAALATEKAARCYLVLGLEQAGHRLIEQARRLYADWGAMGKASALDAEFPFLKSSTFSLRDAQPLFATLQKLTSLRSVSQLASATAEFLRQISGATDVQVFALDARGRWMLKAGFAAEEPLERQTLEEAENKGLVAGTVIRLGLRSLQTVFSEDAVNDARFAGDPRFRRLDGCSLLAVPAVARNRVLAFIVLENRRLRGAFTREMADIVETLCGQLAVSIENSRLYQSLEDKVEERTRELREAEAQAADAARGLRVVLDNMPVAVAENTLTSPAEITFINEQFTRTFGYTLEDIPTVADWSEKAYPDPDYRREVFREWDRAVFGAIDERGRVDSMEFKVTSKDGTKRDIIFRAATLPDRLLVTMTDVTERRKTEAALRSLREKLERTAFELTENIPVGTYTMVQPPDGGMAFFSFMSARFLELTGVDREAARLNPMNAFACVHPEDHEEWVRQNAYVFEHKLPFKGECRVVVGGETRWITAESAPRDLPDGSVVWEGVLTDITARKEAELKLSEAYRGMQIAASAAKLGFWDLDVSTGIDRWDEGMARIHGIALRDFDGDWQKFVHPEDLEKVKQDFQLMLDTDKIFATEYRVVRPSGALRHVREHGIVSRDGSGRPHRVHGVLQDITEEKESAEKLRQAAQSMQLAAAAAGIGFWSRDDVHAIEEWDDQMLKIYGVTREEFDGNWEAFVHPEDLPKIQELTKTTMREGKTGHYEFRIIRPDGNIRHVRGLSTAILRTGDEPAREIGVDFDITEEKAAAAREKQLEENHRRDLENKLRTSLTAAAVAHEINQPLSAILLQSKMILGHTDVENNALQVIAEEAQRVVVTIDKMKTLLRNVQTEHRIINLAEVTQSTLLYNKGILARRRIAVRTEGLDQSWPIMGDAAQLQLALTNLIRNAVEAIAEHKTKQREIGIELCGSDGTVELVISDSGPGWDGEVPADLPLFTTKKSGSGIGLYVVRTAMQNHGGQAVFGRSPLGGAEVRLKFPRVT